MARLILLHFICLALCVSVSMNEIFIKSLWEHQTWMFVYVCVWLSKQYSREVEAYGHREPAACLQLPLLLPECVPCTLHWQRLDTHSPCPHVFVSLSLLYRHLILHTLCLFTLCAFLLRSLRPSVSASLSPSALFWQRWEADLDKCGAPRHRGNNKHTSWHLLYIFMALLWLSPGHFVRRLCASGYFVKSFSHICPRKPKVVLSPC